MSQKGSQSARAQKGLGPGPYQCIPLAEFIKAIGQGMRVFLKLIVKIKFGKASLVGERDFLASGNMSLALSWLRHTLLVLDSMTCLAGSEPLPGILHTVWIYLAQGSNC